MAPSAVETVANIVTDPNKLKLYPGGVEGVYKESSPVIYRREDEEKGIEGFSGAKVCLIYF